MSVIEISSQSQLQTLCSENTFVVIDFYADWCAPCKEIAPLYAKCANASAQPGRIAFVKVNVDRQKGISAKYEVTSMPTFVLVKNGTEQSRIQGADVRKLTSAIAQITKEAASLPAASGSSSASFGNWLGATVAKGYYDITDQVDKKGLDILNQSSEAGTIRVLFDTSKPSALSKKGKAAEGKDWVESDTDEQLMLLIPFQSNVKIYALHLTSLPEESDDDEAPGRPKTVKIYINTQNVIGFDEADSLEPTQEITLEESDWKDGTAVINTRFVRFQRVSTLSIFLVDAADDKEKVRLDRIRIIGESGEKREMGKLEKIGDAGGE